MTAPHVRPLAAVMLILSTGLIAGCDRVSGAMGLTGTVGATAPQLIGPERLRVTVPDRGAQAVLGPVSRTGGVTVWQTLDGITLAFRDGALKGTRGLGDDLMSADVSGDLAMLRGTGPGGHHPHIRSYLDGENRTVFRSYQCRRTGTDRDSGHDETALRRVTMRCVSPHDSFTNVYWLDGAGAVIRSRQWVGPQIGYMETQRVSR